MNVIPTIAAAVAALFAFLTVREARLTRIEERKHWTLGRLERLAELVGDLGKQVGDASTRSGNLWFILATFTQRQLMALLAAMPEEDFALPECRALVQYEVDRQKAQRIYDRTKAALIELAHAIDVVGRDPRPMSGLVAWLRRQPTPRHLLRASLPATYPADGPLRAASGSSRRAAVR